MKKILLYSVLLGAAVLFCSCEKRAEEVRAVRKIELRAAEDQYLLNFVVAGRDGLSVSIGRNDALYAGATAQGYAELVRQVELINSSYDAEARKYWEGESQRRCAATKTGASFEGTYDRYNVLECDKFLENFVYAEDKTVSLKISEEEAVLCGATREGYRTISADVAELGRMVQAGEVAYDDVRACFDAKREYIVRSRTGVPLLSESETLPDPPAPPQTYGAIELKNGMRQGTCLIYGPEELIGTISVNNFFGKAVLQEQTSGKQLTHLWGYNSHDTFKALLIYPEGGRFYFTLTKGTDEYDASSRFVDVH